MPSFEVFMQGEKQPEMFALRQDGKLLMLDNVSLSYEEATEGIFEVTLSLDDDLKHA